ncbi:AAA family ATPase [Scopulibacillus cellulosilyticus]|uniref:AAA family ATPase n=2 Tax=Scopulibacillus cellulosilyticus TaxID=2665665 RepID=A0ABW2PQP9_9BACL
MTKRYIVLTSEFGSGARLLGKCLSEELGLKFYGEDDLLIKAARDSDIDEKVLRDYDEKLGSIVFDESSQLNGNVLDLDADLPFKIFKAYSSAIFKTVKEGPCILMERGADIVLRGKVDFLNVYCYTSDMNKKIERCMRVSGIAEKDAPKFIAGQVMQRKFYYKSFSNIERGKMSEYDLCINTDTFDTDALSMEKCTEIIKSSL